MKQQGFTLLELLVVLFIVVLGVSIVAVNISSGNTAINHERTARDIVSALRHTRNTALMSHRETAVVFDVVEHNYKIVPSNKVYKIPEQFAINVQIAKNQLLNEQQGSIRFFNDGSSSGGRVLLTRDTAVWQINVIWLTGQIELEQR